MNLCKFKEPWLQSEFPSNQGYIGVDTLNVDGMVYSSLHDLAFMLTARFRECNNDELVERKESPFCTTLVLSPCPFTIALCGSGIAKQ